jgi:hypothetical protein
MISNITFAQQGDLKSKISNVYAFNIATSKRNCSKITEAIKNRVYEIKREVKELNPKWFN